MYKSATTGHEKSACYEASIHSVFWHHIRITTTAPYGSGAGRTDGRRPAVCIGHWLWIGRSRRRRRRGDDTGSSCWAGQARAKHSLALPPKHTQICCPFARSSTISLTARKPPLRHWLMTQRGSRRREREEEEASSHLLEGKASHQRRRQHRAIQWRTISKAPGTLIKRFFRRGENHNTADARCRLHTHLINTQQVHLLTPRSARDSNKSTVNIACSERALSERSHLVNGSRRDRSTPSKEKRAKELRIQCTFAFSATKVPTTERVHRMRAMLTALAKYAN